MSLRMADLRELSGGADAAFGGKASGLARLIGAGAEVPEGFAVEATEKPPALWTEEERDELRRRCGDLLRLGALAARSSALGEDSAQRSYAGLFETVLGVGDLDAALAAAERCIASGGGDRVLQYSGTSAPLPVGVVFQRLVDARAAGVCFTVDPTGKDAAVVIEAVAGLGDALVSGRSRPERWRAYLNGFAAWEARREGGPGVAGVPEGVLDAAAASRIAGSAHALAKALGEPLDLEWAIDAGGKLFWLQARPITSRVAPPSFSVQRAFEGADDGPVTVWSNWNVRETMPDPLLPLTWTYWRDVLLPVVTNQVFGVPPDSPLAGHVAGLDLVHGRIYFNMNMLPALPLFGPLVFGLLSHMDSRAGHTLARLRGEGVLRPRRLPGSRLSLAVRLLGASLASAFRLVRGIGPRRSMRALEEDGAAIARRPNVTGLSDAELIEEMRLWTRPECRRLLSGLQMETVAAIVYMAATKAFEDRPEAMERLTVGIPANPTTQISLGIEDLAEAAGALAPLLAEPRPAKELLDRLAKEPGGAAWLARLDGFLARFGHRGPMEFDLGATRWAEDPGMIVALVRARLAAPGRDSLKSRMARLGEERRQAIEGAVAASPAWRRPLLRRLARWVELYMPLREAPKHYGLFVFDRVRKAALELGRRLSREGVLGSPEDVFYLEWPELVALGGGRREGDMSARIAERRQRQARFHSEKPPDILRSDGVPVDEEGPGDVTGADGVLRGAAISPGQATGPVRVLAEPDPSAMEDGDVLVLEFADPGWTPLFPRASAVVMEVGGVMCHAAVVAREMGIPAVFGVTGARQLLRERQRVCVDGSKGTVTPA